MEKRKGKEKEFSFCSSAMDWTLIQQMGSLPNVQLIKLTDLLKKIVSYDYTVQSIFLLNVMLLTAFWRLWLNLMCVVFILPSKQHFKQSTLHFAPPTYNSTTGREGSRLQKNHFWAAHRREGLLTDRVQGDCVRGRWRKGERQRTWGAWGLSARVSEEQKGETEKSQGQGGEAESKGPRTQASPGCSLPSLPIPQVRMAVTSVTNQV